MADDPTGNAPDLTDLDDDALLAELARVLERVSAPPPEVVEAAKGLFTWRTVDAELAELTHDSLIAQRELGVRAAGQPRILTFEAGGMTVEVEVDDVPGARRLIGQLTPPGRADLELRSADDTVVGSIVGSADELGRFVLDLPAGKQRSSLRIRRGAEVTETAWVPL
ncbi:hypothetical protein [Pseudonocardia humida]|uniref:Uncharacterized protein n=1 Tax=Pseudonocardia humida TaxID=2800819 RepID=A0ABT1ADV1_9PSEU|nr:hypothetical protein [Pseudonocardia humida]MCO1661101.1 hypothetical protein [Pseudonocardia humida]